MKYVIKKTEQGFPFYIKSVDVKQRALSIEVDPTLAKQFDSEEDAKAYMRENGLKGKSFSVEQIAES
jgi:hypothetical protein